MFPGFGGFWVSRNPPRVWCEVVGLDGIEKLEVGEVPWLRPTLRRTINCATCGGKVTVELVDGPGLIVNGLVRMAAHLRDVHGDERGALDLERAAIGTVGPKRC